MIFLFIFFFCYRRLYTGYWPTVSRRDAKAGVGGNRSRLTRGEQVGNKDLLGVGDNVCKHGKYKSATDSALQYLLNNTTTNDFKSNQNFKRKSTFTTSSDDGSTAADGGESTEPAGKCCKVTRMVVNEGESKIDKTIEVDVVVPDEYILEDFSISDEGIISLEGELMF